MERGSSAEAPCSTAHSVGLRVKYRATLALSSLIGFQHSRTPFLRHSMTWSARASTDGGMTSPSAFAVRRLTPGASDGTLAQYVISSCVIGWIVRLNSLRSVSVRADCRVASDFAL